MQRYFAKDIKNDDIILFSSDEHHIKNVMRMKNNDLIEVVFNQRLFRATIVDINVPKIKVKEEISYQLDGHPFLTLIVPTLKEQKLDLILQKGTETGINEFIIVPFERSIARYDDKKINSKLERWQKICKEASEQSMRIDIPTVRYENNLSFIKDLPSFKLICSTNEKERTIKSVLKNIKACDKIAVIIGPEGGISTKEEDTLCTMGCIKVTLGQQIMRVETVPIFLASIVKYEYME